MSINMEEEVLYLKKLYRKMVESIDKLSGQTQKRSDEFYDSMKYLWENQAEMDPMEILSNRQSIDRIVDSGMFTAQQLNKLKKLLNSPYFARIDFIPEDDDEEWRIYIGRYAFVDEQHNYWVYDWRAPISSMYYDYETGQASYIAPAGVVNGEIISKKQYKIKNGKIEFALESSMTIGDEVLQRELSNTSEQRMKNIVATIQKQQNIIIRDETADVLVIQGVAGSGKTSVALHRIAFLLYKYRNKISSENIVILSPNRIFADYISGVLPELGEEPIAELSLEDIAVKLLGEDIKLESLYEQADYLLTVDDEYYAKRVGFKSSIEFLCLLDEYLQYADTNYFIEKDYKYKGYLIEKSYIKKRFMDLKNYPVLKRLEEMSEDLSEKFKSMNVLERTGPTKKEVYKKLLAMLKYNNSMELYQNFYTYIDKAEYFMYKTNSILEYSDVFSYIYVKMYFEAVAIQSNVQHLLIDEMQDYTPIEYAVLGKLYKCKKTILGDFGQSIIPQHLCRLEDYNKLFPVMELVELNKSYRSTYEIMTFAQSIQANQNIEPVQRHGEKPKIVNCIDNDDMISKVLEAIAEFNQSKYETLAVICKNSTLAKKMYALFNKKCDIKLLDKNSVKFSIGAVITDVFLAMGLEFDEVIVIDTDNSKSNNALLYVACTRAMHKLTIIKK